MPVYPNPAGGEMTVANRAEAEARGWTPSMGTFGARSQEGGGGGGGGGGAAAPETQSQATQLYAGIQALLGAQATGNKQAFDEAVRQFNQTFGLDTRKFEEAVRQFNQNLPLAQAAVTGQYQGAPTLAAQQQQFAQQQALAEMYGQGYGNFGMVPTGQQTLAAQQQAYAQQLGAINAAAALQANPFRQQQVTGQLGRLLGGQGVAGFQAPNTVAGVGTAGGNQQGGLGYMQQLIDDIKNPAANTASMNQVLNAIPTPTKLNSVDFMRAAPSTQNMVLQGMQEKYGLDPGDALQQIRNTLPGFQAPATVGQVRR